MGARSKGVAPGIRALLDEPLATTDPKEIRRALLDAIRDAVDADVGVWYSVVDCEGELRVGPIQTEGDSAVRKAVDVFVSDPAAFPSQASHRRPPRRATTSFLELEALFPRDVFERTGFFRRVWEPFGFRDQIRLLAYDGDLFLGWIGALRHRGGARFVPADRRRLAPIVELARARLRMARALETKDVPVNDGVVVCRANGAIEFASEVGEKWLHVAGVHDALVKAVRAWKPAVAARPLLLAGEAAALVSRADGRGGGALYLATLWHPRTVRQAPDATLSDVQRTIARRAAKGETVDEIAAALGRDRETVRSHLREAYRRLGTSSRVELARMLDFAPRGRR